MEFGRLLREYRLRAGWTQEQLAERSGVSVHAISVLESGRRRPRLSSRSALAAGLELGQDDRAWLLGAGITTLDPLSEPPAPGPGWLESLWPTVSGAATVPPRARPVLAARLEDAEPLLALADLEPDRYAGLVVLYRV